MAFDSLVPQPPRTLENSRDPEAAIRYAERALAASRAAERCRTVFDVPFGDDPCQKLDLYLPQHAPATPLPVLIYFHGGAWSHGYKEWNGFMAPAFVDLPAIFVSASYRLVPEHKYPAALEVAFSAIKWVYGHIAGHGGDRDRITVAGWSAGGNLAAMVALRYEIYAALDLPADVVKSCHASSTAFRIRRDDPAPGNRGITYAEFLLSEPENDEVASPINFVDDKAVPFFIAHGSDDFPHVVGSSREMVAALERNGTQVLSKVYDGLDHYENNLSQASADNDWVATVRSWMVSAPGA